MSLLQRINETRIAQLAHFAWGAYIPVALLLMAKTFHITSVGEVVLLSILIPAAKEAIECLPRPNAPGQSLAPWEGAKQTFWDGILDFTFFMLGFASICMML